jgi:hypothetical protein
MMHRRLLVLFEKRLLLLVGFLAISYGVGYAQNYKVCNTASSHLVESEMSPTASQLLRPCVQLRNVGIHRGCSVVSASAFGVRATRLSTTTRRTVVVYAPSSIR